MKALATGPTAATAPAPAPAIEPAGPYRLLRWPAPALGLWLGAELLVRALAPMPGVWLAGCLPGLLAAALWTRAGRVRRTLLALGWPLLAAAAVLPVPPLAWAGALALALLAYPLRAWRDAPLFPTPSQALEGIAAAAVLPPGARVLDAGCGTGDGLRALHRAYPRAALDGVEHSRLWAAVARWRCRGLATVRRGDLWADDWGRCDLVYLFQRPETMPRAWAKAVAEARPGAWLASLQFPVPGQTPETVLNDQTRWPLYLYRLRGAEGAPGPGGPAPSPEKPAAASTRRARRR